MAKSFFYVLSNPVEGRDADFNAWYSNQHIPDCLKIPGIVAAKRFKLSETQRSDAPSPYQYMAVYEFEGDNPAEQFEQMRTRAGTPLMPTTDSIAPGSLALLFEPMDERKEP